ncbi:MAG TPA: hypothetical protein VNA69_02395 [Thermoanaerobaculia bacterium]|nr:hypothetical protein [Thermoanaerobaculia bacterium]
MRRWIFPILLSGHVLLIACSGDPKPSKSEIEQSLAAQLPAFVRVSSFSVEAMQNIGTKVEPVWQSRFHASVKVTSPTFTPDSAEAGVLFVRANKRDGDTTEVFGKSVSTLYAGRWRTQVLLEGQPIEALGRPENAFGTQKMIVRGSKDEAAYLLRQEAQTLLRQGRVHDAYMKFAELDRLSPDSPDVKAILVRLNAIRQQEEIGRQQLAVAKKKFDEGLALFNQKKFTAAIPLFRESFSINPSSAEAAQYLKLAQEEEQKVITARDTKRQQ